MSEQQKDQVDVSTAIDAEVSKLEQAASVSVDLCLLSKLIAIRDRVVREKLVARLREPHIYEPRGVTCLPTLLGNRRVLFRFVCRPSVFCLVDPSFLAIIDPMGRVTVQDPYVPVHLESGTRQARASGCGCKPSMDDTHAEPVSDDPVSELADIVSSILGQPVTCAVVLNRCRRMGRCNEAFRHLRQFNNDPSAANARDLADWIGASSMNERCMKAVVDTADTVEWAIFIAAVVAAA